MRKRFTIIIYIILIMVITYGCSNGGVTSHFSLAINAFESIEKFHNHMISVMESDNNSTYPLNFQNVEEGNAVNSSSNNTFHYYVPSWLPEGFLLGSMGYSDWSVGFEFSHFAYDYEKPSDSIVLFEWVFGADADLVLDGYMETRNLKPAANVEGLYYYDYGASTESDVGTNREYSWIQNGYIFHLRIPLWTIDGKDGRIDENTANVLIMNSALKVDILDGEYFEPPTDIELDETEAELEINETIELTADVTPHNATIDTVFWSSNDNRVATVDQYGAVTRVGPGSATITARTVANDLIATFELIGTPMDYGITELSANEILHYNSKDIEVTATFINNISEAGYVPVELLYGGAVYHAEDIFFDGSAGQEITRTYLIENLFPVDRDQIMARINYEFMHAEEYPDTNSKAMPPMSVPVPQFDLSILFMKVAREGDIVNIEVAFKNSSYEFITVPILIMYDSATVYDGSVTFNGIPFEVITKSFTTPVGIPFPEIPVEAQINWSNKESEENPDNNVMIVYIEIE